MAEHATPDTEQMRSTAADEPHTLTAQGGGHLPCRPTQRCTEEQREPSGALELNFVPSRGWMFSGFEERM